MAAPPRSLPLLALALGVAVLVVQIRVIAGGQTWDDARYHTEVAPPRLAAAAAVSRGELPAWWDGSGLGVALAGEPSHGALYPPNWLARTPRALDLIAVLHLAWAALGVAVWARRRASDRAALVAGVLAATTGILISAALRGALPALAHLPWLAVAAESLARAPTPRSRARAAAAIAALLGAIALVGQLAVAADAIAIAIALGATRATARWIAAALGAGLAIGAAQWIPAALQLPRGAGAEVAGLPIARLIELLVPGAFGGAGVDHAIPAIAGGAAQLPSLFVGAPLLALAAVGASPRRLLGAIGGLAAAALIAGRGGWPAWLGAPELHLAALALVLAAASADGLDALALGRRRAVRALGFAAGLTALALAAVALLGSRDPGTAPAVSRALLDGGLGVACITGAAVLAWRAPGRRVAVLCGLLVAPGVGATRSVAPLADRAIADEPPAWAQRVERRGPTAGLDRTANAGPGESSPGIVGAPPPARVFRPAAMAERPALDDAIATLAGASAWRWRIAAARSDDPARSADHDRTWLAAAHEGGALLDRFAIGLAILPATVAGGRGMHVLGRRGSWALVELPVAPPASVMTGWRWAIDPGDALSLLFPAGGGTGVLRGTVVLGGAGPPGPTGQAPHPCSIDAWRDGDITTTCTADRAAYAVVSSAAAPGWTVTVDDQPADWLPADVLRRAVAIPAGRHRIRWTYTTPGQLPGALVTLLGLLAVAAIALAGRRPTVDASGELTN